MAPQDQHVLYYYLYPTVILATILLAPLLLVKLIRPGNHQARNPPPGPWQLPVIGSLHHLVGALPHYAMRDLARRHGPLMLLRLGELDLVVASSPTAAREVLRTHDAVFATRPQTATIRTLTRNGVGIAMAPQGEHWRQARMLCVNELLSARRVRSHRSTREAEAARLVASLASDSAASPGQPVNVISHLAAYANNAVVRAVVGDRITDRDAFLKCMDDGVKVAAGFSLVDLFPSSRLARALSGTTRRLEAATRNMLRLMDGVIEEHRARRSAAGSGSDEEDDLLDVLLRIQRDGAPLHIGTIRAIIIDLFAAGSETTASTLQWAMAEMMRFPEVLGRAQAEVRSALAGQGRVQEEALPGLRYMQLVIKETLRLHPVAPLLLPRGCQEPCRVLGYDVPEGAMVLVNAWAIGRQTATWGPDAEEFRPERFEDDKARAELDFRGNDFQFLPFGSGRRMCPGVMFSMAVTELGLASLLFHFDWELPRGTAPAELDMAEAFGITARRKNDLCLHATLRVSPDS